MSELHSASGSVRVEDKWFSKAMCIVNKNLVGQVVIVTGANTGIGKETTRILARTGATVILACRNEKKAQVVVDELKKDTHNQNLEFMKLDLNDLDSIQNFVTTFKTKYQKLNILINNAGIVYPRRETNKNGHETTFATNHIGPFYLTVLLLDMIKTTVPSRIVNLSSDACFFAKINWDDLMAEKKYSFMTAYAQSKLANVLFTQELQKKLEGTQVKAVCVHPGAVKTDIGHDFLDKWYFKIFYYLFAMPLIMLFGKNTEQGAQTTVYCALEDNEKLEGGIYYHDCKKGKLCKEAQRQGDSGRLWRVTEELITKTNRKL